MMRFAIFLIPLCLFAKDPNFNNLEGTAVIYNLNHSTMKHFGDFSKERLHPCSTFKILNSLIALDTNVVQNENEIIVWDRVKREYDFWNKDHSMRSAIGVSAVWFYQELARRIGVEQMQMKVSTAHYGNHDTSKTLIDFWLGEGSLLISAEEQVVFLSKLMREELPFSKRAMSIVKNMLILEQKNSEVFAGKTGSCGGTGWFVGYIKKNDVTEVFSFALRGKNATGIEAKRIAYEYFKE